MCTYVLAGTPAEYRLFLRSVPHDKEKYKQITKISDLKGLYGEKIMLIGSYDELENWEKYVDKFTLANFQYVEI